VIVDQLWRFPVKSMLGSPADELEVTPKGVVGDRGYALVDVDDGKVVSAKNPRKWAKVLELRATYVEAPAAGAELPPVEVAFPDGTALRSDRRSDNLDETLSTFLGRRVRLTSTPPAQVTMEETWPGDVEGLAPPSFIDSTRIDTGVADETVSDITMAMAAPSTFFDLAALHLLTTATLRALSAAHPDGDFDVRRYRPNVLVATDDDGYVENGWVGQVATLGTGGAAMRVTLPTMRCIMTTMAQPGLPADRSLLRTIAAENRIEMLGGHWACAGVYGDAAGAGVVRVGDPVTLAAPQLPRTV
jgi:hypothetical protein